MDFASTISRFETPLLRYAHQILGPGAEAEDVVQETFIRLHRQAGREGHAGVRCVHVWLFRVTHNLALDAARARDRRRRAHDRARGDAAGPPAANGDLMTGLEELVRKEAQERALAELRALPDEQRQVLTLKIIQGLSLREIGEVLGLSPGNVDYKLTQGLGELARRLKAAGVL